MHELALAEAVVATALEVAARERIGRITGIEVRVGELQSIDRETFAFALRTMIPADEPRLAAAEIRIEIERARLRCRPCGREFLLEEAPGFSGATAAEAIHFVPELAHAFLRCPGCASPDFAVEGGRGVTLHAVEGE